MKSLRSIALLMCAMSTLVVAKPVFAQEAQLSDGENTQEAMVGSSEIDVLLAVAPISESSFAVAPATVAVGAGGAVEGGAGGKWHHEGPLSGANALTDDQYEKLYSLRNQFMDSQSSKYAQLGVLHRQLKDSLAASDFDAKRSASIASKITSLKSEIDAAKMDRLIASAQVLTSDQRKALHEHMIRHAAMIPGMAGPLGHGHHHGWHGEHGEHHHE